MALAYILPEVAFGFTLFLDNGFFYGPGNAVYNDTGRIGVNKFVDAEVKNIFLPDLLRKAFCF